MTNDRALENRLRRQARGQGLRLVKSHNRTPEKPVFGTYGLIDPRRNIWAATGGRNGYGLDLDAIEHWLMQNGGR